MLSQKSWLWLILSLALVCPGWAAQAQELKPLQGGTLGRGTSALELSLGLYRFLKLEYSRGISSQLDFGIWGDAQPLLFGTGTVGIFSKLGHDYSKGAVSFRIGAGYAPSVLGDNIAGHGVEGSGEGSHGLLYEFEVTNELYSNDRRIAFITQAGVLITNQRNTERARYGAPVNKLTYIPYLGLGFEKPGKKRNFFLIIRITDVVQKQFDCALGSYTRSSIFPDAKLGFLWHF